MSRIRSLLRWPAKARLLLRPEPHELSLYRFLQRAPSRAAGGAPLPILIQGAQDPYYFGLFGLIVTALRAQRPVRVEQYVMSTPRVGESASVPLFVRARLISWLSRTKWQRLYGAFCDAMALRGAEMRFAVGDAIDLLRALMVWRGVRKRGELAGVVIDGVPAGDLINDTYLRFKPAPTVDPADSYLWVTIWNAHRQIRRARWYFRRARPAVYLTSYSTYIQHGVAVRAGLQSGVRVHSFGNYQEFAKELSLADWVHTKNPDHYAAEFARLDDPQDRLAEAERALTARMSGAIDTTAGYMRKSAYTRSDAAAPDVRGAVVVFLHDFFDSPHVYRGLVFVDFWEWIRFTMQTLQAANIRFFLKPHPNQIDLNAGVLRELQRLHPGVPLISPEVTNTQLVEAGMVCAVTVYGTVAHEMAFLGVPSIACGHHPHVSFRFCRTATSRAEYAQMLRNPAVPDFDKPRMRRESLMFFYMHNLNLGAAESALRDAVAAYRQACADGTASGERLAALLDRISILPAFRSYIANLAGSRAAG